ncbi:DDE_3 domain-containing protein [Trichonephila clavipes]|nr:DDE_3 domain-containing protein [Trichonephila clavipes]
MDDNVRPQKAQLVDECLQSEDIQRLDWPAMSPDLNSIEHVSDVFGRSIAARRPAPTTFDELKSVLAQEWVLCCHRGWKMELGEEDQISSSINHIKNLKLLTSSKYNELNEQVTLSEWTKTAQLKKSLQCPTNWHTKKEQAKS